ncbi:MAG: Maf family protein [Chthoniobacteraceae bacterium]|nr:Maf family protein [Chthoniobacteraceae bacterium]
MLILASASPRRRQLLTQYGYTFTVEPADIEEEMPPDLSASDITLFNARQKALHVAEKNPGALVIGVDTVVAFDGAVLGKPADMDEAFAMGSRLNGRIHEVYSAVWAVRKTPAASRALVEVSRVKFRTLDEAGLRRYLARIHPLDKAGAYAAQDESAESIVESIEGSRTNVIGLPMEALKKLLQAFGPA